jgi:hypothetical protein
VAEDGKDAHRGVFARAAFFEKPLGDDVEGRSHLCDALPRAVET